VVFDNVNSDRVRRYRSLHQASARKRSGLYLVEGPQSVRELVRFAPGAIETLYLTEQSLARYSEIHDAAQANSVPITLATDEVIKAISENAQQVLAVTKSATAKTEVEPAKLVAVLHNVRDPGNAGTVIRVADAAGADLVILTGDSVDLTNPKVVRSTAGSLFHLPVTKVSDLASIVQSLKQNNIQVLAAAGGGDTTLTSPTLDLTKPTAWIFGNEAWGLSQSDAALADKAVSIPIYGQAESLNLATAAAVCLYASANAQH